MDPGPAARATPLELNLVGRSLVLVAGIPGAGKSTLLTRLTPRDGLVVLDSEQPRAMIRDALARIGLADTVPYPLYRPLVHLWHRAAVIRAVLGPAATVVVHLPATSIETRAAVARLAAWAGRTAHLVWLDVPPHEALAGQRARGRTVCTFSFARHVAHGQVTSAQLQAGDRPRGWATVTVLDRSAAARGLHLKTQ